MRVQRYTQTNQAEWDDFVRRSKNGTFLFCRDYMEYHAGRFADHSLLIRDEREQIAALLPAHLSGTTLTTHAGLTYGGFVCSETMKTPLMLRVFDCTLSWLRDEGVTQLAYKTIPHIYHRFPAEEDRYALWLSGAQWTRSTVMTVADQQARMPYQERRTRRIRRASRSGLSVERTSDLGAFWKILCDLLRRVHDALPVHSLEEITLLASRFPSEIQLYAAVESGTMVAGVLVYETPTVARVQYIASNQHGRETGAVDLILDHLLNVAFRHKRYLDFGSSEEDGGRLLNEGLIDQKEGFGARGVALDQYRIDLDGYTPGRLTKALI